MIKIEKLSKSYDENQILKNISLDIDENEIHGLIGKSGSGKSTLLRTINGIEEFDSGKVSVLGKDIKNLNQEELLETRKEIGMIFQDFALLNRKNVFDNVALPLRVWDYKDEEASKRVKELLDLVGILDKLEESPLNLSGGQRQRVAIARALALNPKILLSDEATSGLDPITTSNILELLMNINEKIGVTIVLVTHEMDVVKKICDRMSILKDGEIVATARVEDFFLNFDDDFMALTENISFKIDDSRRIIKIVKFTDKSIGYGGKLIADLEKNIDFYLESANIEDLKNGKLEQYYINIDKQDQRKVESYLSSQEELKFRTLKEGENVN